MSLNTHPLRIGLSMDVEVETRDESGTQLAAATNTSYRTDVFEQYGDASRCGDRQGDRRQYADSAAPKTVAKRDQAAIPSRRLSAFF